MKQNYLKSNIIGGMFIATVAWLLFAGSSANAATIAVSAGNDAIVADSVCSLSEAIENINAGSAAAHPECAGVGVFGVNDTIQLPSGNIYLTADLPVITKSIAILGSGMSQSIVDGNSQYSAFEIDAGLSTQVTVQGFRVQAYAGVAMAINSGNVSVAELEVDGTNSISGASNHALSLYAANPGSYAFSVRDVYVHDVSFSFNTNVVGLLLVAHSGADVTADLENITIHNIAAQNSGETAQGIGLINGAYAGGDSAQVNLTAKNITIDTISSIDANSVGVGITTFNDDTLSEIQTRSNIANVTIRNVTTGGVAAISGGIGQSLAGTADDVYVGSETNVANLVLAENMSNCNTADMSSLFGNTGVIATASWISQGGNISDDATCAAEFTHATDKNNITTLGSFLGNLGNNGGLIPTIALLAGSLAVDGGVVVPGLSADARGISRPQGAAFDSGAFELVSNTTDTSDANVSPEPAATNADSDVLASTGMSAGSIVCIAIILITLSCATVLKYRRA